MTCSFHKFKDYFPGTGHEDDIGFKSGKNYAVNFPLSEGMDDQTYFEMFKPIIQSLMDHFKPEAILM